MYFSFVVKYFDQFFRTGVVKKVKLTAECSYVDNQQDLSFVLGEVSVFSLKSFHLKNQIISIQMYIYLEIVNGLIGRMTLTPPCGFVDHFGTWDKY